MSFLRKYCFEVASYTEERDERNDNVEQNNLRDFAQFESSGGFYGFSTKHPVKHFSEAFPEPEDVDGDKGDLGL